MGAVSEPNFQLRQCAFSMFIPAHGLVRYEDLEYGARRGPARNSIARDLTGQGSIMPRPRKPASPFRCFNSSPEVIRLVVLMNVRYPLSLRNVEDLLPERGIDICYETVGFWWNRFGPLFARNIRKRRVTAMRAFRHWRWHLDEMVVKLNGEKGYLWRAVDHEGEILESFVTKRGIRAPRLSPSKRPLSATGGRRRLSPTGCDPTARQ